ncbi:ATP-dependent zinc protease [soil metagenome]
MRERLVIGWREWVGLPGLGGVRLRGKIDTGAKTSALHARGLKVEEREGREMARFRLRPDGIGPAKWLTVEAEIVARRSVRSSNGVAEERPVISTEIVIGGRRWRAEVTLTNRGDMTYAMLIGREALRGRAVIDPGASYAAGRRR